MNAFIDDTTIWINQVSQSPALLTTIVCAALALVIVVRMLLKRKPQTSETVPNTDTGNADTGAFGGLTDALAAQLPESEKENTDFRQLLRQAGFYSPTARASIYAFRFVLLFLPLVGAAILAILAPREHMYYYLIGGGLAAAGLSIIPRMFVLVRRNNRLHEIRSGLSDMMDMLSMCIGGGMPLSPSIDHVAKNLKSYPALAYELRILKRQAEVGSLKLALTDLANRLDIPEIRQVTSLLTRNEQLGTHLAASLHAHADHMRSARRQTATMQANKMPIFLTLPLMFCFAPAVLIMLMAPAMLQLTDFLNPQEGENYLGGNGAMPATAISRTLDELDQ